MRYALIFIFSLFMLCPQTSAFARPGLRVRAEVDKNLINMDELLTYKLTVTSNEKNVPTQTPDFTDFSVVSMQESVSFQQGSKLTTRVLVVVLAPQKTGKLEIKPAQVTFLDKVYFSRRFRIKVQEIGAPKPDDSAAQQEPAPEPEIPDSSQSQYNL